MELYTRYHYTTPADQISTYGVYEILRFVGRQTASEWQRLNPHWQRSWLPGLPETWEWRWLATTGEYRGKFPRRVAQYYYKEHGLKCPADFLAQLGNLARAHTGEPETYHFEFVDDFDWVDGDFGDHDSCYWGSNAGARLMLRENGAWAICFYDDDDNGLARAWLVTLPNNTHIVFNGYGFADNATLRIAQVLAAWLGKAYQRVHPLRNRRTGSGTLWINGDTGYVVGDWEDIRSTRTHDFWWEEIIAAHCYDCGDFVTDSEMYYGADDNTYCQHCYYQQFDNCEHCGETAYRDEITVTGDDRYVCEWCLGRDYSQCDDCGEFFRHTTERKERRYCAGCLENLPTTK